MIKRLSLWLKILLGLKYQYISFIFSESGEKVSGDASGKSTSTSNTSDAGKSKKGFSG